MQIVSLVLFVVISSTVTVAQLPPFRFVGRPESGVRPLQVVMMNDRIVVNTDGEHYLVYHRSTGNWSPLTNLNALTRNTGINVLNDSLIVLRHPGVGSEFVIWNVDDDRLVDRIATTSGGLSVLTVTPDNVCVQVDQDHLFPDQVSIVSTALADGTIDIQPGLAPPMNARIKSIWARRNGGYWVETEEALFWTAEFADYTHVADLYPSVYCAGHHGEDQIHVLQDLTHDVPAYATTFTSPNEASIQVVIKQPFTNDLVGAIGVDGRVWTYRAGADDGLYNAEPDSNATSLIWRSPQRILIHRYHRSPSAWSAAYTNRGFLSSTDNGQTWSHIPFIPSTPTPIDSTARIAVADDGSVMILARALFTLRPNLDTFQVLPTDIEIGSGMDGKWYYRDWAWLGVLNDQVLISDDRGITRSPAIESRKDFTSFSRGDTIFLSWYVWNSGLGRHIGGWHPGILLIDRNPLLSQQYKNVVTIEKLSIDTIWYGGYSSNWAYTTTGLLTNIQTGKVLNNRCPGNTIPPNTMSVLGDKIALLAEHGFCRFVVHIPKTDLSTGSIVGSGLPFSFFGPLEKGHDQLHVGIVSDPLSPDYVSDSLFILSPDMLSAKIRRFENITEARVFDIAYDPINRVYYALTERGLYRSDPVVTSVASDDQRPAYDVLDPSAEIPLQTSWYTTLGQRIEPPTNSGVYLKIEFDDKGQMVTEKVLIP